MFNLSASQIIELEDIIKEKEKYLNSNEYHNLCVCENKANFEMFVISKKSEILGMYNVLFEIIKNNNF